MDFFKLKKSLAILMVFTMICVIFAVSVNSQQLQGDQAAGGGAYAIPGLPGITLGPGTNTIALGSV